MKRNLPNLVIVLLVVVLAATNWYILTDLLDIRSRPPSPAPAPALKTEVPPSDREPVRIGVISRFAPNVTFTGYQPIMDYLNANSDYHFELRLSTSYQDAVDKLIRREVTASFLGTWIFGHLAGATDLVPLVAPRNATGQSHFHAVLITRADSRIQSLNDLAGVKVALPSVDSWSGNWLQIAGLPSVGLTVADLDTVRHFEHHQTVVWEVLRGRFAAGVVKESVANDYRREGLRIVLRSPPIPGPPLAARRDGPPEVLADLTRLLLQLDPADPRDQAILAGWTPEFAYGFVPARGVDYTRIFRKLEARP